MRKVLQLMFIVFVGSSLAILLSLIAGQGVDTDTIIYQHVRAERVYRISVLDTARSLRLGLAGTRCYGLVPAWHTENEAVGSIAIAYYQEALIHVKRIHNDQPADAVERPRCP